MLQGPASRVYFGDNKGETGGAPDMPSEPQAAAGAERLSVLIVDDAEDTRFIYDTYFQFRGVRVVTAADGAAALQSVRVDRPDVIILDLAMPKVTGWEVLEQLKSDPQTRTIPVLVLSGQQERESAIRAGADAYLEKPCLPDALLAEAARVARRAPRQPN